MCLFAAFQLSDVFGDRYIKTENTEIESYFANSMQQLYMTYIEEIQGSPVHILALREGFP